MISFIFIKLYYPPWGTYKSSKKKQLKAIVVNEMPGYLLIFSTKQVLSDQNKYPETVPGLFLRRPFTTG